LTYRDELEAAEARVDSLERELAGARERRDELAKKGARKEVERKPERRDRRQARVWIARGVAALIVAALIVGIASLVRYCNNAPVRQLDDQCGAVIHAEVAGHSVVAVTRQGVYDDGLRNDLRIAQIDIATGAVHQSPRLFGGRGAAADSVEIHGRTGSLLWLESDAHGLQARTFDGEVALDRAQVAARLPAIKRVGVVIAGGALHVGGDDGYWYQIGDSAEAVRVPAKPVGHEPREPCGPETAGRARVEPKPDSPHRQVVIDGEPLANTAFLEIDWLSGVGRCPVDSAYLIHTRSRIAGPVSVRLIEASGQQRWESETIGALIAKRYSVAVAADRLLALPYGREPVFAASLETGEIAWQVELK
jgi:hypothetical protein